MNNVTDISVSDFSKHSMTIYGKSVIEDRALPRIEDGLKPVQRLLVWTGLQLNTNSYVKSANIIGRCIGNYHPHGDTACYGALVYLVNQKHSIFEGQGNFGSDTTEYAAQRYTEARLSSLAKNLFVESGDLDSVPYEPNYDDSKTQPVYLPTVLPLVLLNDVEGIAVAIKTNIPGHNIKELSDSIIEYIKTNDIDKSLNLLIGPDNSSCKLTSTRHEILDLYKTGEGTLDYDCIYDIQPYARSKFKLKITGFPYNTNILKLIEDIDSLEETTVANESSKRNGTCVSVIADSKEYLENKVVPLLKKKVSYKMNILIGDKKQPKLCSVKDIYDEWIKTRISICNKTIEHKILDAKKEIEKCLIRKIACENIKLIASLLSNSENLKFDIKSNLNINDEQAESILSFKLDSLKKTSLIELDKQIQKLNKEIEDLEEKKKNIKQVIISQIKDFMKNINKERKDLLDRQTIWTPIEKPTKVVKTKTNNQTSLF